MSRGIATGRYRKHLLCRCTLLECRILAAIEQNPDTEVSELTERLSVTENTIDRALRRLKKRRLIAW